MDVVLVGGVEAFHAWIRILILYNIIFVRIKKNQLIDNDARAAAVGRSALGVVVLFRAARV